MKKIRVEDAVGHMLPHDFTKIVRGVSKGVAFKKGHIVTEADIPELLSIGKEHIYVLEIDDEHLHENDAAEVLVSVCENDYMERSEIKEGKIELKASCDGFFQVDVEKLAEINFQDEIMMATRMGNLPVKKGDKLAGMRVIPLVIEKSKLDKVKEIGGDEPILKITPFKKLKGAVVTTGSEVYHGRIKDTFTPVIKGKFDQYDIDFINHETCDDEIEDIKNAILNSKEKGAEVIICTGGMSVDPDDLTPAAIKASGAKIISYGSPVLPGAMLLIGYFEDGTVVFGVPGCAMYAAVTVFDIVLPYAVAGIEITKRHLSKLGYGGLCLGCEVCHYPNCQFGKGV